MLYPEIYPGILTGETSVSVESAHHHQNVQNLENVYFRFIFNNLKVTKWGFRYLLKISLKSNPACYTIETTFGPFNVAFRNNSQSAVNSATDSNRSTDIHFVWTSQKCHPIKIDLQANVVLDRSNQQMLRDTYRSKHQFSVPTSRYIDYLCDLNVEKLSIFLINFLANRAANNAGDLLPTQMRAKQQANNRNQKGGQKQFLVSRDFAFLNENDYATLVREFIVNNKLTINGTQCLQMNFRSKNVSMLSYSNYYEKGSNVSDTIRDVFNQHYQSFVNYQKQNLRQKLMNMTFIYSSELFLKIKQIFIDDSPIYVIRKDPTPSSSVDTRKQKNIPRKVSTAVNKTVTEEGNRNFDKRKIVPEDVEVGRTSLTTPNTVLLTTEAPRTIKPDRARTRGGPNGSSATETRRQQNTSIRPNGSKPPKMSVPPKKSNQRNDTVSVVSNKAFLTGKPLIWVFVLFANTLIVFAFIVILAYCYYRSKLIFIKFFELKILFAKK